MTLQKNLVVNNCLPFFINISIARERLGENMYMFYGILKCTYLELHAVGTLNKQLIYFNNSRHYLYISIINSNT